MREFVISETKQRRYSSESLAKDETGLNGREVVEEHSFIVEKVDKKVGLNFEVVEASIALQVVCRITGK